MLAWVGVMPTLGPQARAAETVAAIKQKSADTMSAVKEPGKMERLKEWAVNRLPYHPKSDILLS